MMATVLRKVKLGNKNKSETVTHDGGWETEQKDVRRRVNPRGEAFVQCGRVCGLVNVCTGPADSMGSRRRRNRPHRRGNPHGHLTLFQSLQLRIDLWTTTTGHLLDRSFTRRFCHRKSDNELYRSNSFRFEKFDKQEEDLAQQEILEMQHAEPRPPVLVIDETTIKSTVDAGPVCGCDEKYDMVKKYKPFLPGGVHPYARRKIPDDECLEMTWHNIQTKSCGYPFDKPVAIHQMEITNKFPPLKKYGHDLSMFLRKPKYTDGYITEKLRQCEREHSTECKCNSKNTSANSNNISSSKELPTTETKRSN